MSKVIQTPCDLLRSIAVMQVDVEDDHAIYSMLKMSYSRGNGLSAFENSHTTSRHHAHREQQQQLHCSANRNPLGSRIRNDGPGDVC